MRRLIRVDLPAQDERGRIVVGRRRSIVLVVRSVLMTAILVGVANGAVSNAHSLSSASSAAPVTLERAGLPGPVDVTCSAAPALAPALAPSTAMALAPNGRVLDSRAPSVGPSVEAALAVPASPPTPTPSPTASPTASPTPSPTASAGATTASAAPAPAVERSGAVAPTPPPVPTPAVAPTPAPSLAFVAASSPAAAHVQSSCTYADVLVLDTSYDNWAAVLVDTTFMLPDSYAPPDLRATGLKGGGSVRGFVVADLREMAAAAAGSGAPLQVVSAYRSYRTQVSTFKHWVGVAGYKQALLTSARPGHSEHQLGTALDFTSSGGDAPWLYKDWATTRAGSWLRDNAWKYGFVSSYPKGKTSATCYAYEPWHYRYFGKERAAAIHDSGLTSRQWLLANG
jgi:zinc D-Ala-D-Ala carboxypeptidase